MSTPPNSPVPRIPELVGATTRPFHLVGSPTEVSLALYEPTGPASPEARDLAAWAPQRVFLNIEKMIGEEGSPPYYVYLNVAHNERPEQHPELYAGSLPMFGLREASITDEWHSPNGLYTQLEVTSLYARLPLMAGWNPKVLRVTFVPKYPGNLPAVEVGRMSLYFA